MSFDLKIEVFKHKTIPTTDKIMSERKSIPDTPIQENVLQDSKNFAVWNVGPWSLFPEKVSTD